MYSSLRKVAVIRVESSAQMILFYYSALQEGGVQDRSVNIWKQKLSFWMLQNLQVPSFKYEIINSVCTNKYSCGGMMICWTLVVIKREQGEATKAGS